MIRVLYKLVSTMMMIKSFIIGERSLEKALMLIKYGYVLIFQMIISLKVTIHHTIPSMIEQKKKRAQAMISFLKSLLPRAWQQELERTRHAEGWASDGNFR